MDKELIGCWRMNTCDMIEGRMVTILAGLKDEIVEFTADGLYRVDLSDPHPATYQYRVELCDGLNELDSWMNSIPNLVTRCVYKIEDQRLTICIAANYGERPTEIRRDDERLWCILTAERTKAPKRQKSRSPEPLLESGSLIPTAFLKGKPKA